MFCSNCKLNMYPMCFLHPEAAAAFALPAWEIYIIKALCRYLTNSSLLNCSDGIFQSCHYWPKLGAKLLAAVMKIKLSTL